MKIFGVSFFTAAMAAALFIFSFSGPVFAGLPADIQQEIKSLNVELETIRKTREVLSAEQADLKKEEKRYAETNELLTAAEKNFEKAVYEWQGDIQSFNAEDQRRQEEVARHNAEVSDHNSRCDGTFEDQSYVDACNQRADQLNARGDELNGWGAELDDRARQLEDRRQTLLMKQSGLVERRNDLNAAVLNWAKRQKENNYKFNELEAREQTVRRRIEILLNSETMRDLIKREKLSKVCEFVSGIDLETAHHCLQRVWDGAR